MTVAAVFGLGSMGYGMAASLARAGVETFGFDVNADAAARFAGEGGKAAPVQEIAGRIDAAVVVVLNAAQVETVLFGPEGVVSGMKPGSVVVACPTMPPEAAKGFAARCAAAGVLYLDAPISGGATKAAEGALTIMASASAAAFAAAEPVLGPMAETVFRLGPEIGAGSAMKAINQLMAGAQIAVMAEAMVFGLSQGVQPAQVIEVISKCAGSSFMLENRGPHIADGDYSPRSAVDIWLKDLGIVLDIAKASKVSAPLAAAALQQFVAASGAGLGREDDAAVAKIYARNAGVKLPGE